MMTHVGELLTSQTTLEWLPTRKGNDYQGINGFSSSLKVILKKPGKGYSG